MSRFGGIQYIGGHDEYIGGYHEYIRGCSVHQRGIMIHMGEQVDKRYSFILKTPMYS